MSKEDTHHRVYPALVYMQRNLVSEIMVLSGRDMAEMCVRYRSTALAASSAFRKIFINTEPTGSQCSDHQEASRDAHIFKEVLGFMVAFHTLGKIPEIVHIDADDERQTCQEKRGKLASKSDDKRGPKGKLHHNCQW